MSKYLSAERQAGIGGLAIGKGDDTGSTGNSGKSTELTKTMQTLDTMGTAATPDKPLTVTGVATDVTPPDASRASDLDRMFRSHPAWKPKSRLLAVAFMLVTLGFIWFVPPVYRLARGQVVVTRYDKKLGETTASCGPGTKNWIAIGKVSKHLLHAVVAAEDGKFYEHHGLDFVAIKKSYELNKKKQRYVRGASTISQQVVKMAFLGREKTLLRKAREASGTLLMELLLPKDKILEWYINLAEFGDGVYGVQSGAQHYFKTKPEQLTIVQSVHLALVLPSPNGWSRGLRKRELTSFGHRRFAAILNTMRGMGFVTRLQWTEAVTRGDFGRPINGYAQLLEAEETHQALCPGSPGCPDAEDDDTGDESSDLSFPKASDAAPAVNATPLPRPAEAPAVPPPLAPSPSSNLPSSKSGPATQAPSDSGTGKKDADRETF